MKRPMLPGPAYWMGALMADAATPINWADIARYIFWIVLVFSFGLEGVVKLLEGEFRISAIAFATMAALGIVGVSWEIFAHKREEKRNHLEYLSGTDSDLGSSIITMARRSAWGRWYAVQHLIAAGSTIGMLYLLQIAGSVVWQKILNGNLEVRGRRPGQLEYEVIPRTHWQSSAFHFVNDPMSLWKMIIVPTGGVEIARDGAIVRATDSAAAARTSQLAYDSFLIDAYQFEKLWPKKDTVADRARRKLLRKAWWRGLDKDERTRLS